MTRSRQPPRDPSAVEAPGSPEVRVTRFERGDQEYAVISLPTAPSLPSSLTPAEREVVLLVLQNLSNAAIAERRQTSVRTVANQLRGIFEKLAVGSRRELRARLSTWSGVEVDE